MSSSPLPPADATVFVTARDSGQALAPGGRLPFAPVAQLPENQPFVYFDPTVRFQTLVGIGGALTDAAAETLARLPAAVQEELLTAYFDPQRGIGYTFARTNIASCDFSSASYAYVAENDAALATFSVAPDEHHKLPLIRRAFAVAGGNLKLLASPWSPPAWMKDNGRLTGGGALKPEFADAWARHFVAFIRAYADRGVPVWGVSVQNEPMAVQRWESCVFTAEAERDFVRTHLGPTLHASGLGGVKLIAWDHNRDLIFQRANVLLSDPEAAAYIWGLGFHWYETWTGGPMQFDNVRRVHEAYPDKALLFTEGCKERFDFALLGDWILGERYAHSMIHDFNAGTCAWCDWNILLDETGGPNHVGNFCFAPVHADTRKGTLVYTNAYHYLGHFSKFIRPGARRIAVTSNRADLETTAFVNLDGRIAVVTLNRSDAPLDFKLCLPGFAASATSQPHSISTYLI